VRRRRALPALAAGAILLPDAAGAHTAVTTMGGFWAGVTHLLTSPDQLALFAGLAIWTGLQQSAYDARVIGAGGLAVAAGTFGAAQIVIPADLSPAVTVLLVLVGCLGAARLPARHGALIVLTIVAGLCAGAEELGTAATPLVAIGSGIAAAAVTSWGLIAARYVSGQLHAVWGPVALRAGASWIAAIGMMSLALTTARYFGRS